MLIAWQNLADAATLSTDSEQASLPASNVQQQHVSRKWQTAAGVKSAYLLLDLGSSQSCALLALLGTNFTSAATLRLRGSVTDPTATGSLAYDSGSIAAGVVVGYGSAYKAFAATASRYWRIDVADATVDDNLAVGRVFLGPSWEPAVNMQIGWSVRFADQSRKARSSAGQRWVDVRPKPRVLEFELDYLTEAEIYANAFALALAQGITGDVLAIPDIDGDYLPQQAVWGALEDLAPVVEPRLALYSQKFTIEETL